MLIWKYFFSQHRNLHERLASLGLKSQPHIAAHPYLWRMIPVIILVSPASSLPVLNYVLASLGLKSQTDSYLVSQHTPIYLYDGSFCVLKLFYCWIGGVVVLSWIILDQIFWWEWKLKWCQKIFAMQTRCRFRNTDITFLPSYALSLYHQIIRLF